MTVAALFVTPRSVYKSMHDVDCFDSGRDARTFDLRCPVVAHPPCRSWGNLAHFAKPREDERDLAWWAMHVVRHCGGVLEHPITSKLWHEAGCLTPGVRDRFGGVLVTLHQLWFGHRAQKATGVYIVGPVPDLPAPSGVATRQIGGGSKCLKNNPRQLQNMSAGERMSTPPAFAEWLVNAARAAA